MIRILLQNSPSKYIITMIKKNKKKFAFSAKNSTFFLTSFSKKKQNWRNCFRKSRLRQIS